MTTLIGCRCKSGNIFSQALLIGRGLFLIEICKQISKGYRWKRKLVSYVISSVLAKRIRWWQIVRKPPVPIPNTVVKTYRGENTWRATAWKDSSLPASNLNKSENWWISIFAFFLVKTILAGKPPASRKTWHLVTFCSAESSRNTVVKILSGDILVARDERVFGFCYKELCSFCKSPPHSARNPQYLAGHRLER